MRQETAHEWTAIDFTEFDKAIEETSIFTHVEDAMWVTDKAHELIKATPSVSNEKLEDHLLPYSKEMIQKIRDEKMQLVTAEEFVKLHQESLTAIRNNDKLQEQLNTAKVALTEINRSRYGMQFRRDRNPDVAKQALAALEGGEDE